MNQVTSLADARLLNRRFVACTSTATMLTREGQPERAAQLLAEAAGLHQQLVQDGDGKVRSCRGCGCTEDAACLGGCWWIETDLCSACYHLQDLASRP